jgi:hypothetical protein
MSRAAAYDTSRGPVIRRETVKIVRLISLDGIGAQDHPVRFEREVLTLRETEATHRLMTTAEGKEVALDRGGSIHNDFYGLFTSQEEIVASARALAEGQGFGVDHPVRRECVVTLIERDLLATNRDAKRFGGAEYLIPPDEWCRDDEAFEAWRAWMKRRDGRLGDEDSRPNRIRRETRTELLVWRSDLPEEQNAAIMAAAREVVFLGVEAPAA